MSNSAPGRLIGSGRNADVCDVGGAKVLAVRENAGALSSRGATVRDN